MKITLRPIKLELKVNWKLSRNEALFKDNFVIQIEDEGKVGLGEIAPNIRYDETSEKIKENFNALPQFGRVSDILKYSESNELLHAFKCGLVCAAIELEAKTQNISVEKFLGLAKVKEVPTSISVPIMKEELLENYVAKLGRFPFIKIKVNSENAISFTKKVASYTNAPLRIDANEGFKAASDFLAFCEATKDLNIQFMEQPFEAKNKQAYLAIRGKCPFEVMADESIEDEADFSELSQMFDSINIKLMKTGGYLKALELIKKAKEHKLKVMIGCMIESSLGIACALRLGSLADYFDLDGALLVKNDPFDWVEEKEGQLALLK